MDTFLQENTSDNVFNNVAAISSDLAVFIMDNLFSETDERVKEDDELGSCFQEDRGQAADGAEPVREPRLRRWQWYTCRRKCMDWDDCIAFEWKYVGLTFWGPYLSGSMLV